MLDNVTSGVAAQNQNILLRRRFAGEINFFQEAPHIAWPKNLMSKLPLNQTSPTDTVRACCRGCLPHKHCLLLYVVFSNQ